MSKNKEYEFLAESLNREIEKQTADFRKIHEKLMKDIFKQGDYKRYNEVMADAVKESIETMIKWEKTSFDELEGLTPEQYFLRLNSADDAVELVSEMIEKNSGMTPPSLTESIHKIGNSIDGEIAGKIDSIKPDEKGNLTLMQKAIIKCGEMISSERILDAVSRLLFRFDSSNAHDEELQYIMDVFKEEGKASIPCLIAACEKSGHKGNVYVHCIMTLGEIASEYKSEEIYMYLKECFRKSDYRLLEANALGLYGDSRAVTALRGYVERNILNIGETEYSAFRDVILSLGGIVDDLDSKFTAVSFRA